MSREEIWRPVPGYRGLYSVSNQGRVLSHARRDRLGRPWPERILRPSHVHGYPKVVFYVPMRNFKVATLVLRAFVGFCPVGCEASHLNGVRADSRLSNLVWETRRENFARKVEHGTHDRGERSVNAKLTEADVLAIRASDGKSQSQLAREHGVSCWTIGAVRRRETWKHVPDMEIAA